MTPPPSESPTLESASHELSESLRNHFGWNTEPWFGVGIYDPPGRADDRKIILMFDKKYPVGLLTKLVPHTVQGFPVELRRTAPPCIG
jgi:hypothetical protein